MEIKVNNTLHEKGLLVAVCIAHNIVVRPSSDELVSDLRDLVEQRKGQEFPAEIKDAVRNLLKIGGFKPSGRNKPASEYLAQAAREDRFPFINNLVDVNNLISLETGLPISLLDLSEFGNEIKIRWGREDEKYVFNAAGQEIDLEGLICACAGATDKPLGNPIKDSIAGKIKDTTRSVVGIMYAPSTGELAHAARSRLEKFAALLEREGGASSVEAMIA